MRGRLDIPPVIDSAAVVVAAAATEVWAEGGGVGRGDVGGESLEMDRPLADFAPDTRAEVLGSSADNEGEELSSRREPSRGEPSRCEPSRERPDPDKKITQRERERSG